MKARYAGILSAVLGSICCVGPLMLIALGLGTGAAVIGRYHWFLVIAAIAVLAWAWTKYFRERAQCACEHQTMQGRRSGTITLLIATVIVLGFGGLNISRHIFASAPVSAQTRTELANGLNRVVIPVEGMTCATCEIAVRHALKRTDGVKSARVSVATKTATVEYEPGKTNPEQLVAAINSTGYRGTLPDETEPAPDSSGENAAVVTVDRISVFKVPLQCPAAPQIGCGSASKPVLLDLEKQPGVLEAWLNRAGTIISVVWNPDSNTENRRNVVEDLKEDNAVEMQGTSRDKAVRDFLSGKGWYHGADVDRLSEEEAGIIALRLIRRVEAMTAVPKEKAQKFQHDLAESWSKCVTSGKHVASNPGEQPACRFEDVGEDIARKYLNQEQLKFWKEAVERGVRPLPNES